MDTLEDLDLAVKDSDTPPDSSTTHLELRVLSGLQAGAALPLDQPLLVGRSDECDLLLLEDHAPPHLLEIAVEAGGWLQVTALHDGVRLDDGTPLAGTVRLPPGQPFGMERLWLEVRPTEAPWAAWIDPAEREPAPRELPDSEAGSIQADEADGAGDPAADDARDPMSPRWASTSRTPSGMAGELDEWLISADGDDSPFHAAPARHRPAPAGGAPLSSVSPWWRRWRTWGIFGAGGLLTAAGLLTLANQFGLLTLPEGVRAAMSATEVQDVRDVQPGAADTGQSGGPTRSRSGNESDSPERSVPIATGPASTGAGDPVRSRSPTAEPSDPAPILLPGRNDRVRSGGGVTVVRGDVDVILPFEVREVVLGARSRVVLTSGQVLLPGEAVGRWRLMEIKAGSLVFDGPQRVLLPW